MAKKLFIATMCLSMSVTAVPAVTGTTQTVSAEQTTAKNGLYHEGNAWNYYTDGAINKANTLVKYNGSWWYVHDGNIDFGAKHTCKIQRIMVGMCMAAKLILVQEHWLSIMEHGGLLKAAIMNFSANTLYKFNGSWWYVHNGQVDFSSNTLVKYSGSWWHVSGGRVNFSGSTVYKYNGTWWYVHGGRVDFSAKHL
jgi:hypothetical protein